jgi:GINS complex subunit 2
MKRLACCDFLAGDELVSIVPSFSYNKPVELMSRTRMGPWSAGIETQVPLWLALLLHTKSLARIVPPDWLQVETLQRILKHEQEEDHFSKELPFYFQSIAQALLRTNDLDQQEAIRILVQDISTIRLDKIRKNLHTLSEQSLRTGDPLPIIDVTGIGSMELAIIAPFCRTAFGHYEMLTKSDEAKKHQGLGEPDTAETHVPTKPASRLRRFR